jgi:hypothetical protein
VDQLGVYEHYLIYIYMELTFSARTSDFFFALIVMVNYRWLDIHIFE